MVTAFSVRSRPGVRRHAGSAWAVYRRPLEAWETWVIYRLPCQEPLVPRRRLILGPMAPLMAFGAVLTAAGAVLYLLPGPGTPLLAVGALVLASAVALSCASRQR